MDREQMFSAALTVTRSLAEKYPWDEAVQSVINQLQYLIDLQAGRRADANRLDEIIIGVLSTRELEPLDPSITDALYLVMQEVEKMKKERSRGNLR